MADVRRNDLARVTILDGREFRGVVKEIREEAPGHERVVIREFGSDREMDTAADRVEVVR